MNLAVRLTDQTGQMKHDNCYECVNTIKYRRFCDFDITVIDS